MWTSFLERVVKLAGGRRDGGLRIETRKVTELDALRDKSLSFDAASRDSWTEERGWHIDDYRQPLPAERPGPPEPGGPWERAQRLLRDYEFADPELVRASFRRDGPLEN